MKHNKQTKPWEIAAVIGVCVFSIAVILLADLAHRGVL